MDDRYQFKASALRHGRCQGGPTDGRMLAHHEDVYRLAYDKATGRSFPGMLASTQPWISFGEYHWKSGGWVWQAANRAE